MRRMLTTRDIYNGRLALFMLNRHRSDVKKKDIYGELYVDVEQQFLDSLSNLGIECMTGWKESPIFDKRIWFSAVYVESAKVALEDWEKEILNDDFIIKFISHMMFIFKLPETIIYEDMDPDLLLTNQYDYQIIKAMNEIEEGISEQYFIFRDHKYPVIPIVLRKIGNYNVWGVVEKIKGMWV